MVEKVQEVEKGGDGKKIEGGFWKQEMDGPN